MTKSRNIPSFLLTVAIALAGVLPSQAQVTQPGGLNPGDQYILAFVTDAQWAGFPVSIATYNAEVNAEANSAFASLGATWVDIGSTATTNAISNVQTLDPSTTIPIYNLAGQLVAIGDGTGTGGLFSNDLLNPIDVTETGATLATANVWTGSFPNGTADSSQYLGTSSPLGAAAGLAGSVNFNWLATFVPPNGTVATLTPEHLYGISSVLTATGPTPEPATTGTVAIGVALLVFIAWRRQRNASASQTDL